MCHSWPRTNLLSLDDCRACAGFCFLCGGTRYLTQSFNLMVNKACCSMLMIASVAIVIPTSARAFYGEDRVDTGTLTNLSHAIAILLIIL